SRTRGWYPLRRLGQGCLCGTAGDRQQRQRLVAAEADVQLRAALDQAVGLGRGQIEDHPGDLVRLAAELPDPDARNRRVVDGELTLWDVIVDASDVDDQAWRVLQGEGVVVQPTVTPDGDRQPIPVRLGADLGQGVGR